MAIFGSTRRRRRIDGDGVETRRRAKESTNQLRDDKDVQGRYNIYHERLPMTKRQPEVPHGLAMCAREKKKSLRRRNFTPSVLFPTNQDAFPGA